MSNVLLPYNYTSHPLLFPTFYCLSSTSDMTCLGGCISSHGSSALSSLTVASLPPIVSSQTLLLLLPLSSFTLFLLNLFETISTVMNTFLFDYLIFLLFLLIFHLIDSSK